MNAHTHAYALASGGSLYELGTADARTAALKAQALANALDREVALVSLDGDIDAIEPAAWWDE